MGFLTWADKVGLILKKTRINQWQDVDANETKAAVNDNDTRIGVLEPKVDAAISGYQGVLLIADTPTVDGSYMAGESGTYTNAGGLVIDLTEGVNYINVSGTQTVFTKTVIPVDTIPTGDVAEGETLAVSGGKINDFILPIATSAISTLQDIDYSDYNLLNGYRDSSGTYFPLAGYITTPLIPTTVNQTLKYIGQTVGSAVRAIVCYDKNQVFHSVLLGQIADLNEYDVVVPTGVFFYAMTANTTFTHTFTQVEYVVNSKNVDITEQLIDYYDKDEVDDLVLPLYNELENEGSELWRGFGTLSTLNTHQWVQEFPFVANKRIKTISFDYTSITPLKITFWKKVGIDFVLVDEVNVVPIIGLNTIEINKTFDTIIYIGFYEADDLAYSSATGYDAHGLGATDFNIGDTAPIVQTLVLRFKIDVVYADGFKDLSKLDEIETPIFPMLNAWSYQFDTAISTDFANSGFVYDAVSESAKSSTLNSFLVNIKNFKTYKRKHKYIVNLKSDSVFEIGASGVNNAVTYQARGSRILIDIPNLKLKILNVNTGALMQEVSITNFSEDEYFIEVEINDYTLAATLKNNRTLVGNTVSNTDIVSSSKAGKLIDYPSLKLISGTIEVKNFDIFLMHKPLIVFIGNSNTESGYRTSTYADRLLINHLNNDGCILAKGGATNSVLALNQTTELIKMKPKYISIMIGTNGGITQLNIDGWVTFCNDNDIILIINKIPCTDDDSLNPYLSVNELIREQGIIGANMDYATALNNDITLFYDPSIYIDDLHPNSDGQEIMKDRFLNDVNLI